MKNVGNRIRECRLAANMTQEEVAKHLGIGKQAVYKYEIGAVTNIPLENIHIMATLFNTSPGYLAGWTDEKEVHSYDDWDRYVISQSRFTDDEILLLDGYRALPDPGKTYMLQQLTAANALFGEKDTSVSDPGRESVR